MEGVAIDLVVEEISFGVSNVDVLSGLEREGTKVDVEQPSKKRAGSMTSFYFSYLMI